MIDPYQILDLDPNQTTDEIVRKAYMDAIRRYPPDREPEKFEQIRFAYDQIKQERDRMNLRLFGLNRKQSILEILPDSDERPRVGAEKWLAMIEEEAKRKEITNPYARNKHESTKR
ncbi:MAG: hypothetical protein C4527_26110 [Candidatus Omnitrophota bacterium]|jgi:DnaJ-class molecular chaperone|nr:MAG: hypothetical protein C4527_26110 [Candidatus Omnitrophota bacterium]